MEVGRTIEQKSTLQVFVLGQFFLKWEGQVLFEGMSRSKKVWELLKYLILNRKVNVAPEMLLETLWPDQEYADPNLAMRSLIYRLRQLLTEIFPSSGLASNIIFCQGCYRWGENINCWVDAEEFEHLYHNASSLCGHDPYGAIDIYGQAVNLYNGDFLPEYQCDEWVVPIRNYYHRIYLQCVLEFTSLLKNEQRIQDVLDICEKSILIDYFDESLHLCYMEALIAEGKRKQALVHYQEVSAVFYREMGVNPSAPLREIYNSLKSNNNKFIPDLSAIQKELDEQQEAQGAFFCEQEMFSYFYQLEKVRQERYGQEVYLGLLTLMFSGYKIPPQQQLTEASRLLKKILITNLRQGDIVSSWNDAQFIIILPGLNTKQGNKVLQRVEKYFLSYYSRENVLIEKKLEPILSLSKVEVN